MNSGVSEVVCIDTLRMDNFRRTWLVNETYYRTELPSVRWMNEVEYLKFEQADLPPYLFFCNQKQYDDYFKMRKNMACIFENIEQRADPAKTEDKVQESRLHNTIFP